MISRRNIRVKVMQTLYTLDAQEQTVKPGEPIRILQKHFDHSRQLLVYLIYCITEVARYAETDSRVRSNKHLPNEQDLNVNIKLAGNEFLWKILEDPSWQKVLSTDKPHLYEDKELIKKVYQELVTTDEYKKYITEPSREKKSEKGILEFIFTSLLLPNELFEAHVEELFMNWDDDIDMVSQLLLGYVGKPQSVNFQEIISKEKWEFARGLLQTVMEKKEVVMDLIKPKLKNWDPERIATLDMILMQMGVAEFLYFETIPPKVTINEYIDLAKEYSTPQSGQFVNGILDNIHKDLVRDDKMHKVNFKAS
ncbi:MAG TPA: transcription antitermination factor NusB [Puia sp.]|jgi:N utilization substance protein B|nr:transcription antitermination factor NusB [Puia sp.]